MLVSGLVLVCALMLARLAEADDQAELRRAGTLSTDPNCQSTLPACVDPSLWAKDARDPLATR